jgi:hypothetical protein
LPRRQHAPHIVFALERYRESGKDLAPKAHHLHYQDEVARDRALKHYRLFRRAAQEWVKAYHAWQMEQFKQGIDPTKAEIVDGYLADHPATLAGLVTWLKETKPTWLAQVLGGETVEKAAADRDPRLPQPEGQGAWGSDSQDEKRKLESEAKALDELDKALEQGPSKGDASDARKDQKNGDAPPTADLLDDLETRSAPQPRRSAGNEAPQGEAAVASGGASAPGSVAPDRTELSHGSDAAASVPPVTSEVTTTTTTTTTTSSPNGMSWPMISGLAGIAVGGIIVVVRQRRCAA